MTPDATKIVPLGIVTSDGYQRPYCMEPDWLQLLVAGL